MKYVQRVSEQPADQLMMAMIGSMAFICALSGCFYILISGNAESKLYTMTSLTVSLFSWGMYGIQKSIPKDSPYSKLITPALIFLVVVVITLYNPMALQQMWVALIFFPIMLSLLVDYRMYLYGIVIFIVYFSIFHIFGSTVNNEGLSPVIMATTKAVYALGTMILGGIISLAFQQHKKRVEAAAFQQQKQQVINLLQCFIPVGERKTQTSRKEIGEMSALLKALVTQYGGGLRVQEWEIDLLSLLHFVSRVKLPDYMFEKEGKLSEFEFEVVQEHCYMAKELCEGIPDFLEVEKAFLYHHEKVDGTGYPYQLSGNQIPLLSQMLGLVEVFLALTTPRSYREEMSQHEAYVEIQKLVGKSFRGDIVDAFGKVIG
ncbi:HD-GYP domain-containing protein [Paenibacillus alba]|uniref:HD domain-containing phosphohydrolase n=1 Tax=Paenibacillus alba TaxID=1197127 RepID=A0ABU6GDB2_9BACL|nr:HD domain-containing phosphohydrolase [Paenibacillus alba]MEC0231237.1 HD domain-containing phosphohydrolase [Paenibacillus alba]